MPARPWGVQPGASGEETAAAGSVAAPASSSGVALAGGVWVQPRPRAGRYRLPQQFSVTSQP